MLQRRTLLLALIASLIVPLAAAETAKEIIERSLKRDFQNQQIVRDYTYKVLDQTTEVDGSGKAKSVHSELVEVLYFGGKAHRRTVAKDGKPLPADDEKKEQEKVNKAALEASKLTPAQIKKREEESDRERQKNREQMQDVPAAFDFTLVGEVAVNGRQAWQIRAEPRRDYRGRYGGILRNLRGVIWIDQKDLEWVRVEAESLDTISFGLFLARLTKGSMLTFENQRVNNEVWAPARISVKASGRIALLKKVNVREEITYSDYRKFRTDASVTSVGEPVR